MKLTKLVVRIGFLVLALSSCAFAGSRVAPFADGERVTFLGDSITHGGGYHVNLQLYWDLRHPGSRTRLMNCGVSGGTAKGGVARWSWDVASQQADRTFVMFGMNDVNRGLYETLTPAESALEARAEALSRYEANMARIAELVRAAGEGLVVMTPTPYDQYGTNTVCANYSGCNEPGLAACAAISRALAARFDAPVVELHRPLTAFVKREGAYCFCNPNDRVHPRGDGHLIIMAELLKAMGETADFGGADLDAKGETKVEFCYEPKALPFPVTEDYRIADQVYPLTETVNREMLVIRNLPPGCYALCFDGREVGRFTDGEFRAGVNLALLPTPSASRALEAWQVSRELLNAQQRLRTLVLVEAVAIEQGADRNDYDDVCAKVACHVERLKAEKRPYATYYEGKLEGYRTDKPREKDIREAEERARASLSALGAERVSSDVVVSKVGVL